MINVLECMADIEGLVGSADCITIAGAGNFGELIGACFNKANIRWDGYVDRRGCGVLNGKHIRSYDEALVDATYIISSPRQKELITKELLGRGVREERIYVISDRNVITEYGYRNGIGTVGEYYVCSYGEEDSEKTYMIMERGDLYEGIFCDMTLFLRGCAYAEKNGFEPVIDRKFFPSVLYQNIEHMGIENSWEYYFEQPCGVPLEEVEKNKKNIRRYRLEDSANRSAIGNAVKNEGRMDADEIAEWRRLTKKYFRLNEEMKNRVDSAYDSLFLGKNGKVMGVSIREGYALSIEMEKVHLENRIQPALEGLARDIEEKMEEWGCDYCFLVCELNETIDYFQKLLGEKVFFQARERYSRSDYRRVVLDGRTFNKERGNVEERHKEYITDVYLMAKCDSLLCGWSSGSSMATLIRDSEFEHMFFYNLGTVVL